MCERRKKKIPLLLLAYAYNVMNELIRWRLKKMKRKKELVRALSLSLPLIHFDYDE